MTIAEPQAGRLPRLHVALSSKWSLRTDRAQDCVSQGAKLVAQRGGRMPHFGLITMETRPSMLKILGDGSGAVDCVYHLNLPALEGDVGALGAWQSAAGDVVADADVSTAGAAETATRLRRPGFRGERPARAGSHEAGGSSDRGLA
ncbi:NgoMIV family type II restriction endonuclease [Actinoplanes couchii]|uniref:NgoMIV family type II restriction endonuclease n=1 Tax=Actinoplanes couchii TaxID=403638 RepID=UPI001940FCC5